MPIIAMLYPRWVLSAKKKNPNPIQASLIPRFPSGTTSVKRKETSCPRTKVIPFSPPIIASHQWKHPSNRKERSTPRRKKCPLRPTHAKK
jgi:hypothetical protein